MWKTKRGFTIVELLVSIAVMAVVSAGVMAAIGQGPRQSARDGTRKADLEKIRSALEIYRNDLGSYPTDANYACSGASPCFVTSYISAIPVNPSGTAYTYTRGGTGLTYSLCTTLERPAGSYCVNNP